MSNAYTIGSKTGTTRRQQSQRNFCAPNDKSSLSVQGKGRSKFKEKTHHTQGASINTDGTGFCRNPTRNLVVPEISSRPNGNVTTYGWSSGRQITYRKQDPPTGNFVHLNNKIVLSKQHKPETVRTLRKIQTMNSDIRQPRRVSYPPSSVGSPPYNQSANHQSPQQQQQGTGQDAASNSRGQGGEYQSTGAYTKFTPKQQKREKLLQQRSKEEQDYEAYKEKNRQSYVRTVPQAAGGCVSEQQRLRQLQAEQNKKKYEMLEKRRKYQEEKKMREEAEYAEKKMRARQQAERNEAKAANRQAMMSGQHVRTNEAFLQRREQDMQYRRGSSYRY